MRPAIKTCLGFALALSVSCANEQAEFHAPVERSECSARVIKNEYLVKFRNDSRIHKMYMDARRMHALRALRNVEWVEPNYSVNSPGRSIAFLRGPLENPNAFIIGADYAWRKGIRGAGILVAVVDSGVDSTHPLLQNAVQEGWNFVTGTAEFFDETGHGTHIAGIIAAAPVPDFSGIAPESKLIAADFMNEDRGDEYAAINAVEYSISKGARVINNSWSNFCSFAIRDAFQAWQRMNVIFVNAAGNDALSIDDLPIFPSNLSLMNGISVGSVDSQGRRSRFSNFGRNVVVYAPGEEVYSLATSEMGRDFLVPRSGTSMSTAYVSGALALLWSANPALSAASIVQHLKAQSQVSPTDAATMIDVRGLIDTLAPR